MGINLYGYIEFLPTEESTYWEGFAELEFNKDHIVQPLLRNPKLGTYPFRGLPKDVSIGYMVKYSYQVLEAPLRYDINEFVFREEAEKAVQNGEAIWRNDDKSYIYFIDNNDISWIYTNELENLVEHCNVEFNKKRLSATVDLMRTLGGGSNQFCRMIYWYV